MSDDADRPGDPLHMNLKDGAAHVHREDVGDVMVFGVENENVYPRQADEIAAIIKAGIIASDKPKAIVDLSRVQFICSAFIGLLIDVHKLAGEKSGEIKLCVTGEHVAYTMKLVKLQKIMQIAGDRQQLLDSFR